MARSLVAACTLALALGIVPAALAAGQGRRHHRPRDAPRVLFHTGFRGPDGLITNEFAHWNPARAEAVASTAWEMTSGSLFRRDGTAWSGLPDDRTPNARSSDGTHSAVFRLVTRRRGFGDVAVSFRLRNDGLSSTGETPPVAWDGVHVFLRYQSQYELYYASVNRRDDRVVIKKKCRGGPSNGGTYYPLAASASRPVPYRRWQTVRATVRTLADRSVAITLAADGHRVAAAVDRGVGCAAITHPGGVGIRGDNADFRFDDFSVTGLR